MTLAERSSTTAHDEETLAKAFVNEDGQTTLLCPQCSALKTISVSPFRQRQHKLKVRCSCSNVFTVNLDFRKCYRKPTNLEGIYEMYPPAVGGGKVKIINLSLEGACIECTGLHKLKIDQKGYISFTLDDRKETRLRRDFTIKMVSGSLFGCEFHKSQAFDKELGFYLRFGP